jgi:hypothetical protein
MSSFFDLKPFRVPGQRVGSMVHASVASSSCCSVSTPSMVTPVASHPAPTSCASMATPETQSPWFAEHRPSTPNAIIFPGGLVSGQILVDLNDGTSLVKSYDREDRRDHGFEKCWLADAPNIPSVNGVRLDLERLFGCIVALMLCVRCMPMSLAIAIACNRFEASVVEALGGLDVMAVAAKLNQDHEVDGRTVGVQHHMAGLFRGMPEELSSVLFRPDVDLCAAEVVAKGVVDDNFKALSGYGCRWVLSVTPAKVVRILRHNQESFVRVFVGVAEKHMMKRSHPAWENMAGTALSMSSLIDFAERFAFEFVGEFRVSDSR